MQAARVAALARRREEKRAERDLARRREYVRRCRLQIEEKRHLEEEEAKRLEEEKRKREVSVCVCVCVGAGVCLSELRCA